MLYVALGAAVVASTVAYFWLTKQKRPDPVVELTEWQAVSTQDLSSTLDQAFTRF